MQDIAITLLCRWISALACTMMVVQLVCCTSSSGSWWRVRFPPRPAGWIGHSESSKVGVSVEAKIAAWKAVTERGNKFPNFLCGEEKIPSVRNNYF